MSAQQYDTKYGGFNNPSAPPPSYESAAGQQNLYPPNQGMTPPPAASVPMYPPAEEPKPDDVRYSGTSSSAAIFDTGSFSDKAIRRGFIRKVYLILFTQLLVTFGITMLFSLVRPIKNFVQTYPDGMIFYYVSYGTFLVTYFVLICIPSVRRKHPGNLICLGVFTLAFSYMVGAISSYYTTNSVMICAGITTLVCLAISIFAIQTKIDFTMCAGLLFVLCIVLLFFGFSCIIVYATIGYNYILDCVWGGLAALVFSLFLVYDTQMIVGGRKHELSPEEYVYGALQLYIDVVYLFLIILSFFGKSN